MKQNLSRDFGNRGVVPRRIIIRKVGVDNDEKLQMRRTD